MLWRMPADLHDQRIGDMSHTQAFLRHPRPATSVSATKVSPPPEMARWGAGLCGNRFRSAPAAGLKASWRQPIFRPSTFWALGPR